MKSLEMYIQAGSSPSGRACGGPAARTRTSAGTWMAFGHANALAASRGPLEIPI